MTLHKTLTKITLVLLLTTSFVNNVYAAYTMGGYLTAGGEIINVQTRFLGSSFSKITGSANLGAGYLWPIGRSEKPYFLGLQGTAGAYPMGLYSFNVHGLLGKEVANNIALYGKLSATGLFIKEKHERLGALPEVGVGIGIGYQATPNLRLTSELAVATIVGAINTTRLGLNLQYSFA